MHRQVSAACSPAPRFSFRKVLPPTLGTPPPTLGAPRQSMASCLGLPGRLVQSWIARLSPSAEVGRAFAPPTFLQLSCEPGPVLVARNNDLKIRGRPAPVESHCNHRSRVCPRAVMLLVFPAPRAQGPGRAHLWLCRERTHMCA